MRAGEGCSLAMVFSSDYLLIPMIHAFVYNHVMTSGTDQQPLPANENANPFQRADTALEELYRIRRSVLARDPGDFTIEQWRQRKEALMKLDDAINTCLSHL